MTIEEFDQLPSNGKIACPICGSHSTTPYPNCHCPANDNGHGTKHINLYHHKCNFLSEVGHPNFGDVR